MGTIYCRYSFKKLTSPIPSIGGVKLQYIVCWKLLKSPLRGDLEGSSNS